jgi:plastocyanin
MRTIVCLAILATAACGDNLEPAGRVPVDSPDAATGVGGPGVDAGADVVDGGDVVTPPDAFVPPPPPDATPPPAIVIGDCDGLTPVATIGTMGVTFQPSTLTIRAGETFKFTTMGRHNLASPPDAPPDKTFSTGEAVAQTRCLTFNVPGIYPFVCTPHINRGMLGTLTVE